MSTTQPVPPLGYSLEDVPAFLRPTAEESKIVVDPPNNTSIAQVNSTNPNEIDIHEPSQFHQPQLNHEETHVFQFSRNPAIVQKMESDLATGKLPKTYTYGGTDGLIAAQRQGKTIADFGPEQQAEMVRNYQQETQEAVRKGDATGLDKLNLAYGPLIRQLAKLPGKNESMTTMTQADLTPAAPGLPPAEETGILAPNKLLGGEERILKSPPESNVPNNRHKTSPILQQVLEENPGLAKNFNTDNTSLVFANGKRSQQGRKERGELEYWFPTDKGTPSFPSPVPGKNVIEVYSDDLKNDPKALKEAVYGDLMHGMASDPYWKKLRNEFMQNFTPQERERQAQRKTWWDDVNTSKTPLGSPTYDAYIRGWITNEGEGKKGQIKSKDTMYSPKQIQILHKMENYLKTGKATPSLPKGYHLEAPQ